MEKPTYQSAVATTNVGSPAAPDHLGALEEKFEHRLFGPFNYTKDIIDEIVEMTEVIPLFDKFDPVQLRVIVSHMKIIRLTEGERLFSEGEAGDFMGFIVSGRMHVFKQTQGGKQVLVSQLSRGRSIGEMAMIDSYSRSATVVASEPTTMLMLNRQHFEQIAEVDSATGFTFLKALTRVVCLHLRRTSNQFADACETSGEMTDYSGVIEKAAAVATTDRSQARSQLERMAAGRPATM